MNKLKLHWKSIIWACIIMASLMIKKVPVEPPKFEIPGFDKIVHFGLFLILSILIYFEHNTFDRKVNWLLILVMYPVLFGGILELIQWGLIDGRSGDWFDLLADASGSFLVFVVAKKRQISNETCLK